MKLTLALLFLLVCSYVHAQSARTSNDGNALLHDCTEGMKLLNGLSYNTSDAMTCVGFARGFSEALNYSNRICVTEGSTAGQMVRVLVKYLEDHPEQLAEGEEVVSYRAFRKAFPCSVNKRQ